MEFSYLFLRPRFCHRNGFMRLVFTSILIVYATVLWGADYYWVGGSGNWTDITHWSTTSGGSTQQVAVPSFLDRVIFDNNSFSAPNQTVTIVGEVFCAGMEWKSVSGMPTLSGSSGSILNVYGDLMIGDMQWSLQGKTILWGSGTVTQINTGGITLLGDLEINLGSGNTLSQKSNLVAGNAIRLMGGNWNSGGYRIQAASIRLDPMGSSTITWQNSTIQFSGNTNDLFVQTDMVNLNSNASAIWMGGSSCSVQLGGSKPVAFATLSTTDVNGLLTINNKTASGTIPNISFSNLTMGSNAVFRGPVQTDRLELTAGHTYTFAATNWYPVRQLVAVGSCEAPVLLSSDQPGVSATLQSDVSQSVEYVRIQDIEAIGSVFSAGNSSGTGITTGWVIANPSGSKKLYWVNGQGDWSDPYHWSLTSGGSGGACIPSGSDDVFFDSKSFITGQDSVTVKIAMAECNNMTWDAPTGKPVMYSKEDVSLIINGALLFDPGMINAFYGSISFQSAGPGNSIDPAGTGFSGPVKFNGSGSWVLKSKLVSTSTLSLKKGELDLNGMPLDVQGIESQTYEIRRLKLGNSTIRLNSWNLQMSGLTVTGDLADLIFWGNNATFFNVGTGNTLHLHSLNSQADEITLNRFGNLDIRIDEVAILGRGIFLGTHHFGTLSLGAGQHYSFGNTSASFYIDKLQVSGSCAGLTVLESNVPGTAVSFKIASDQTVSMVSVRDIVAEGGQIKASASVDEGNTSGWSFTENPARTLYWVGGGGLWEDPMHWAAASGGTPGECIPTANDNVIFDDHSFSVDGQMVHTDRKLLAQCFDFTWNNPVVGIQFNLPKLEVHHSIRIQGQADWSLETLRMMGDAPDMIIAMDTFYTQTIELIGLGTWTLEHDLHMRALEASYGHLITADYSIIGNTFRMYNQAKVELGNSLVQLDGAGLATLGTFHVNAPEVNLDAGHSRLLLTHVGAQVNLIGLHSLYHVLFSNPAGNGTIKGDVGGSYRRVEFYGSGRIEAENTFDSLIFNAGRTYVLESGKVQVIGQYWRILGTPCTYIILRSTDPGKRSVVSMAGGVVSGDNIIIRDQETRGGATFFAGRNSVDASNNLGWQFEQNSGVTLDGLLGADVTLCSGQSLKINEVDLIGAQWYVWNDSISTSYLEVHDPGQVTLYAYFGQNCEYRDTLNIRTPEGIQFDLGADTAYLCEQGTYAFDITVSDPHATYLWSDGATTPNRSVAAEGIYRATVSSGGCTFTDSIYLDQIILPNILVDTLFTICSTDSVSFHLDPGSASFTWSDGSLGPDASFTYPGWHWVEAESGGCVSRDSFRILDKIPAVPILGNDTLICGTEYTLRAIADPEATYLWSDGQITSSILISTSGVYVVVMDKDGCSFSDTIQVTLSSGSLELPDTLNYCMGDPKIIDLGNVSGEVRWSDGGSGPVHAFDSPGIAWVSIEAGGCVVTDTFLIAEQITPQVKLPADTMLCPGSWWSFDASFLRPATLVWEDGSTDEVHKLMVDEDTLIVLKASLGGCIQADSLQISLKPIPVIDLGSDTTLCNSGPIELGVETSGTTVTWDDGSTDVFRQVLESGHYWAEADLNGCSARDTVQVNFLTNTLPYQLPDTALCNGSGWQVSVADIPALDYVWSDGTRGPAKSITTAGRYILMYEFGACSISDTFQVRIEDCDHPEIYIPNLFSPNGDGFNDYFTVYTDPGKVIRSFRMQIMNRWGSLLADIPSMTPGWDGLVGGTMVPAGTYIYRISVEYEEEGVLHTTTITGDLTLVR